MKKIFSLALVALFAVAAMAEHQIGAIVGTIDGVSYKYVTADGKIGSQTDLGLGLLPTGGRLTYANMGGAATENASRGFCFVNFTVQENAYYQIALPKNFTLMAGAGTGVGYGKDAAYDRSVGDYDGKAPRRVAMADDDKSAASLYFHWNLNAFVGAEYRFPKLPIVLAADLRPGYDLGVGMTGSKTGGLGLGLAHSFYWGLNFSCRYIIPEKVTNFLNMKK